MGFWTQEQRKAQGKKKTLIHEKLENKVWSQVSNIIREKVVYVQIKEETP